MARSHHLSPSARALLVVAAVAAVGGWLSPVPVRSQIPRLDAPAAPSPIPGGDPWDAVWDSAPSRQVPLSAQVVAPPFGGGGVTSLTVRALHDRGRLFILLEWADDDVDDAVSGSTQFSDAAALEFPMIAGDEPPYTMGSADHPVMIWQWKAVWQADLDRGFDTGVSLYPDTAVDVYPNEGDDLYITARHVGNQLSDPAHVSPVENLLAEGFGTLTPARVQDVSGAGSWRSGVWRAMFFRDFVSVEGTATFSEQDSLVAFAVWDGGAGDRNGQKSIAPFIALGISGGVAAPTPSSGTTDLGVLLVFTGIMLVLLIVSVGGMVREWARRGSEADG